jgi:hypothetical protein
MKVRKTVFVSTVVAVLFGGPYLAEKAGRMAVPERRSIVDGTDPMPLPRPTRGTAIAKDHSAPSISVADGTDPMPRPPRQSV